MSNSIGSSTAAQSRRRSLCGGCILENICAKAKATVPSLETVRQPATRLTYQHHLVGIRMSYHALIDYHIQALGDFLGRFEDESGTHIPAPGFASLLNPGAEFWFRDQIERGKWRNIDNVPYFRKETTGRWRIIGTVIDIKETIQPVCGWR